jgi:hypothetical protein
MALRVSSTSDVSASGSGLGVGDGDAVPVDAADVGAPSGGTCGAIDPHAASAVTAEQTSVRAPSSSP